MGNIDSYRNAALVILYESSINGKGDYYRTKIENTIDKIRRDISMSRKEAQYILNENAGDIVSAALVLAYEGIGRNRVEDDFFFSSDDISKIYTMRSHINMTEEEAFLVLSIID